MFLPSPEAVEAVNGDYFLTFTCKGQRTRFWVASTETERSLRSHVYAPTEPLHLPKRLQGVGAVEESGSSVPVVPVVSRTERSS